MNDCRSEDRIWIIWSDALDRHMSRVSLNDLDSDLSRPCTFLVTLCCEAIGLMQTGLGQKWAIQEDARDVPPDHDETHSGGGTRGYDVLVFESEMRWPGFVEGIEPLV
jgi:hypothetical protein